MWCNESKGRKKDIKAQIKREIHFFSRHILIGRNKGIYDSGMCVRLSLLRSLIPLSLKLIIRNLNIRNSTLSLSLSYPITVLPLISQLAKSSSQGRVSSFFPFYYFRSYVTWRRRRREKKENDVSFPFSHTQKTDTLTHTLSTLHFDDMHTMDPKIGWI